MIAFSNTQNKGFFRIPFIFCFTFFNLLGSIDLHSLGNFNSIFKNCLRFVSIWFLNLLIFKFCVWMAFKFCVWLSFKYQFCNKFLIFKFVYQVELIWYLFKFLKSFYFHFKSLRSDEKMFFLGIILFFVFCF